jgi:hypothetical protein
VKSLDRRRYSASAADGVFTDGSAEALPGAPIFALGATGCRAEAVAKGLRRQIVEF